MSVTALLQVPSGWLACVATLVAVVVACSLHAVVQRVVGHEPLTPHNAEAGVIVTVIGTLYAVILGFVVVVVWQGFTTASDVAASEANALAKVYRLARGIPEPAGKTIRAHIDDYAQSELTKEWPLMVSTGVSDRQTGAIAREIANEVVDFKPSTSAEGNLQAAMLEAVGQFLDDRRSRLTYLEPRIPGIL
jgi:heme/copper-type cytochrome/quinol oxidase subunit 2